MDIGIPCRLFNFLIRCIYSAVSDIIPYRSRKEENILLYQAYVATQRFQGVFLYILSVYFYSPLFYLIKTGNEMAHGRLAAAGRTYQCYGFSGRDAYVDIIQNLFISIIGKADIFKHNISMYILQFY